jgi:hypothetical protein
VGKGSGRAGDRAGAEALRVFISYSRADVAAAEAIADALARNGFDVKIDVRDLPYGEEWQAELAGFIAGSDTVLWLVSPDSVRSRWVNWELGEVVRLSKRLVPVRVREVQADALPESLGRINLLPNRGVYHAATHEQALVATLNANRGWLRKGTSLAEAAAEWNAAGRDSARLLRGRALKEAEGWSARPPRDAPAPASGTLGLILASRRAQQWRRRITAATAAIVAIAAVGLAWFGQVQAQNAREQERVALEQQRVAQAASAQRRNEVSRKLLEAENQVGTAIGGLAAAAPAEADAIARVRAAWAERLTPIRDVLKSDGAKLWLVSGKQVLSVGDRLAAFEDGVAVGFARVSAEESVLVDTAGRVLVIGRDGGIVRAWRWRAGAGGAGEPLADLGLAEIEGLSRLKLFSLGPRVLIGVGTIEAGYAGGEEPRGIYLDLAGGVGAVTQLFRAEIFDETHSEGSCQRSLALRDDDLAALRGLYETRGAKPPFRSADVPNGLEALCVEAGFGPGGEVVEAKPGVLDFIAPAGETLSLPVLRPEASMWREVAEPQIERAFGEGWDNILPLGAAFGVSFLPHETFYERAMFKGGNDDAEIYYTQMSVGDSRFGTGVAGQPPALKIYQHADRIVIAGMFFDRWREAEFCWFGADWVVEACVAAGTIYDTGGGVYLTPVGDYAVVASRESVDSRSLTLVDIGARRLRAPSQRSQQAVVDVSLEIADRTLTAIDVQGVVWNYRFPEMELISTYDLGWPESSDEAVPLRLGSHHLDFSSRGVVRRLDVKTQTPVWIATPFDAGSEVAAASISSDETMVMVTSAAGEIRIFDAATGMPLTSAFDPGRPCHSIEHDPRRSLLEIACDDRALQRMLQPVAVNITGLDAFALDSTTASATFFSAIPAFDLGDLASASLDIAVPPIGGRSRNF